MLIDAHAHVNFKAFKEDWKAVVERSLAAHTWMINIGSKFSTSEKAIAIATQYPEGVYASAGFHPIHVKGKKIKDEEEDLSLEEFDKKKLKTLAQNDKIVCIGETGLDYYRVEDYENKEKQKRVFTEHLEVAQELDLPVMLHCRDVSVSNPNYPKLEKNIAYQDLLTILKEFPEVRGAVHCFGGSLEIAQQFIAQGFLVGFTGIITFKKKAEDLQEVVRGLPLDKIMVETDCPYLTPEPHRSERNEPAYVKHIAEKIAELKNISFDEVAEQTTKNIRDCYRI